MDDECLDEDDYDDEDEDEDEENEDSDEDCSLERKRESKLLNRSAGNSHLYKRGPTKYQKPSGD
jgi:hypothetical protein